MSSAQFLKKQRRILKIVLIISIVIIYNKTLISQQGFLKIDYNQPGLTVTLDDSVIGILPLKLLTINKGPHKLSILNPHRGIWKCDDWVQRIQILPGDTTVVRPFFNKLLTIISNPFDAQVFINNQYFGNTPIHLRLPALNSKKLVIKKENYNPYSIDLSNITSSSLKVILNPNEQQTLTSLMQSHKKKKIQRYKKLAYSLIALSICSGFTTAYLKYQAENKYDQYLTAGNLQDMNRFYNDSKRLDKFSNISLGVFEVSFVFSFFFLIRTAEY